MFLTTDTSTEEGPNLTSISDWSYEESAGFTHSPYQNNKNGIIYGSVFVSITICVALSVILFYRCNKYKRKRHIVTRYERVAPPSENTADIELILNRYYTFKNV